MTRFVEVRVGELGPGWSLAPERHGEAPAGARGKRASGPGMTVPLGSLVTLVTEPVSPPTAGSAPRSMRVLDTGDALEGFVRAVAIDPAPSFRSMKKRLRPGDVIVSRLRPYLRQVGLVDAALFDRPDLEVVASSEFYVLRGEGVAALIPWLLSAGVQRQLAAAQEGGHHPRVARAVFSALPVPASLAAHRLDVAARVEGAVASYRQAEVAMRVLAGEATGW